MYFELRLLLGGLQGMPKFSEILHTYGHIQYCYYHYWYPVLGTEPRAWIMLVTTMVLHSQPGICIFFFLGKRHNFYEILK